MTTPEMPMTPEGRAFSIVITRKKEWVDDQECHLGHLKEIIAVQIREAEQVARDELVPIIHRAQFKAREEGFNAAKEKAAEIAMGAAIRDIPTHPLRIEISTNIRAMEAE